MNKKDWLEARFIELSKQAGCIWDKPNGGHYKNGRVNYYPWTRTYTIDGRKSGRCSAEIAIKLAMRRQIPLPPANGEECGPNVIRLADILGPEVDPPSEGDD